MQFYSVVSPKIDALKMDPKFLDRNVNEGFSGGERKRNEILQLSVRYCNYELAWHLGLYTNEYISARELRMKLHSFLTFHMTVMTFLKHLGVSYIGL